MKSVAIIGAGPGGLVAAKTLLHSHPANTFSVTIFEKSNEIGGLWNVKNHTRDGFLPPNMPTNLSRYSVAFSDLSWEGMRFGNRPPPMFPKAWQVQEYLEEYAKRYIPKEAVSLRTEVKFADRILEHSKTVWKIKYSTTGSPELSERTFDHLLVATGFFAQSRPIQCKLDGFNLGETPTRIIHSSKYRALDDILPAGKASQGNKILVIGGANSGGEVAAAVAFDISSRQYSPGGDESLDYQIVHITPRPIYGLPLFVPGDARGTFLPLDMKLYNIGKRPDGPISFAFGRQLPETSRFVHGLMQSTLGTDKYEVGFQPPVSNDSVDLAAPYAAIQEHYAGYVRSGLIAPRLGRVASLTRDNGNEALTAVIEDASEGFVVKDVAAVLYATGYTPAPALAILSSSVKKELEYDPDNLRLPLLIYDDAISSNPSIPDLGFVGFYEGPYWGVMEMQARSLACKWAAESSETGLQGRSENSKKREKSLHDVRDAMKNDKLRVPQYVFSDYLAILEQTAEELSLERNDNGWSPREGPVAPARYLDYGSDRYEAQKAMSAMQAMLQKSAKEGLYVARATFRGLQGDWKIHRKLSSVVAGFPTGILTGTASFCPRMPTDPAFDFEYLYIEKGSLVTDQGFTTEARRRYVYRYSEEQDEISVWFVKQDGKTVDYFYHRLDFETPPSERREPRVVAKGDHLCEADFYSSFYRFLFDGVALVSFTIKHIVKGPKKDYVSETLYER
ncbi:MAG: hypothetical protein LQ340_006952 [Diploschistes diacapsis]|nr:MAG: hypothetical protein LQ340_006952 [Diploschistes diacapsis]